MSGVDAQIRDGSQGAQIGELALRLLRVVGTRTNERGEVPDTVDLVVWQEASTECREIEPAEGGVPFRQP